MTHESIGVVGAGLVGCLAALAFSNKGYKVKLFDLRSDPRLQKDQRNLRSINLAVSDRGIRALKSVDEAMAERILQHVIPMKGRMIHDVTGTKQESQIYGLFGESINSIDRSFLNSCLLDELDKIDVEVFFGHKLVEVSNIAGGMETPKLTFLHESERRELEFDYVIGADGAHSQFRYQMQKYMRMDFSQKYIDMQYMELSIPAVKDADPQTNARFSLDPNHLHIWPRKDYMLIALANGDGSFTSTFFSPWGVIESISSATEFLQFFKNSFPNAYDLIGEDGLRYAFEHQPRGSLIQVSASPYASPNDRAIIIGDAAHSMVPFYGQGMNCGFEDVNVLTQLLDKNQGNLSVAFHEYTAERKQDLDTICKLALDNYYEMSTKVTDPFYLLRKKIDYYLGKYANDVLFPWVPMYSMISFRGDIRYSEAAARERRQTKVLNCIQYITLGGFAIAGFAKAAQLYQKYKR